VRQWVSNQGAHFRNQVVESLQRALGAQHHFTTAYTPWDNGTVEVVNREVLKSVKALLSERKPSVRDWPAVLPVLPSLKQRYLFPPLPIQARGSVKQSRKSRN
jgi:transposase InsO family protein